MADVIEGKFPHVEWIDLYGDGIVHEVAVMKRDHVGSISYIKINSLDDIDKTRLVKILNNRNINNFELWDIMSQVTLGNGVNALAYFHQLVKVLTPGGKIIDPTQGARAAPVVRRAPVKKADKVVKKADK